MGKTFRVTEVDGLPVVSSEEMADFLGMEHEALLREIDALAQRDEQAPRLRPNGRRERCFFEDDYWDTDSAEAAGRPRRHRFYWVSEAGCAQIAEALDAGKGAALAARCAESFADSRDWQQQVAEKPQKKEEMECLGTTEFREMAYWLGWDGSVYRKLSETRYRKPDGEEYSTYRLLDGNQKIVYAMDDTLLEPYKMLARAPSLEPDLGKALLEQAEELYYQKGDHAFDTIYDFMRDALEDKDPRWAN